MENVPNIRLHIDGQVFLARKDVLCEHSDYFSAMFSGNYVEKEQQDISIDVVDAHSMGLILRYMDMGLIDLSEHELPIIGNLAMAARFLQITELIKQIEYCLDLQLSLKNWMETMTIAENASYTKLEQLAAAFGFLSFKLMQPEYIPTLSKLIWYLSHPFLDTLSELDVFKFGMRWISKIPNWHADTILVLLTCLDVTKITCADLLEMTTMLNESRFEFHAAIVKSLLLILGQNGKITRQLLTSNKEKICNKYSEKVFDEAYNILKESKMRKLTYTPAVPIWSLKESKLEFTTHYMYTFDQDKGFERWLEIADKNLWGWNIVGWGAYKLVLVCGEHGRGTGIFMRDVRVYDTLRKEWTHHGVELPPRRHGGVTVLGDKLFITGGVGGFRVVLETAIIYDLNQRTFRKIATLPDALQSPAVCSHDNSVFAAGQKNIYQYEDLGETDRWVNILSTDMRINRMTSFKNYIYCTQNYFSHLYRFRPGIDKKLEIIIVFDHPAAAICNFGNRLLAFTRPMCGHSDMLSVEEYKGEPHEGPKVLWSDSDTQITVNDVAGSCTLVMSIPPLLTEMSPYHQQHLTALGNISLDSK